MTDNAKRDLTTGDQIAPMTLGTYDIAVLRCLAPECGLTTAWVSKGILPSVGMFGSNMHQHSGAVRAWLNEMLKAGLVRHFDDEKPVAWSITTKGRAALDALNTSGADQSGTAAIVPNQQDDGSKG
jgi:hypothetical protein